jgi:UPF0755 protein
MNQSLAKYLLIFTITCFVLASFFMAFFFMLKTVENKFGPANDFLSDKQRIVLSVRLFFERKQLTEEHNLASSGQVFIIDYGESLPLVAQRLKQLGLIGDEAAFLHYLQYKGLDQSVQAGEYQIPATLSDVQLATLLQDATPTDAIINVLAGWRMDEVAASLPNTGVEIEPTAFLVLTLHPENGEIPFDAEATTLEGFLYPGRYRVPRDTSARELIDLMTQQFEQNVSGDIKRGIEKHGLTLYQGLILASIIEREAMKDDEMPYIASVFYNRIALGMKLESDPTIQYALGQAAADGGWWKVPLSAADLQFGSLYNTYLVYGLPPTPICNPSMAALQAVADPEETEYLYFMAKCDGSGYHNFSVTFEQHVQNICY